MSIRRQSEQQADKARRFVEHLTHTQGRWSGSPFTLMPWQTDCLDRLFGTLKPNGKRQYRTCYLEIPKKNGKTELGAAVGLKMLVADGENGAEVYSAAGDRQQAGKIYEAASVMVQNNHTLSRRLTLLDSKKRIVDHKTNSFYQVLSSESFTKHGLNPSCVLFDELHAQPNRKLWDVLTEGTDYARDQQLVFVMTTAGEHDVESIGWEVHDYAKQVRDEVIEDETFLPIIYAAENDDDWEDERVWRRCNPALGHIFDIDKIRTDHKSIVNNPVREPNFRRFRLNEWLSLIGRYLPMHAWDACDGRVNAKALAGADCYGGLDLSSTTDMTAFVMLFPPAGRRQKFDVIPHLYLPENGIELREKQDKVPYRMWAKSGLLTLTPGNRIDYKFVIRDVLKASRKFNLLNVGYDPWGVSKLVPELEDDEGIPMEEVRQGYRSLSEPTKELLGMVLDGEIRHGGHRVLRWNADNLKVRQDDAENVKPVKLKDRKRIDGIVALIMAIGLYLRQKDDQVQPSIFALNK